ncbi:unnamed protein product [Cuscuta europaea]|uniref:Uncharacterized protein n=1 Tax=Cuscuta europaea TaxID=41803 RepID=A0A9P1E397_CUSEU|nr:unnamed protein product [Cuscuta europaea]
MNFININDLTKEEVKTIVANVVTGMKVDLSALPLLAENQKRMAKIIQRMNESQLSKIVAHPYEEFSTRDVAEFYLNATITKSGVHSKVQGKSISLNVDALNEFFGVQLDSQDPETPTLIDLESVEVSVEAFAQTYCRPEAANLDRLYMKKFLLKKDFEKLVVILHRSLWCKTGSTDEINKASCKAIFVAHHGMNINWGEVIFGSLTEFIKKKDQKTGLFSTKMGHGLLLSAILTAHGVQLRDPSPVDHSKTLFLIASPKLNIAISAELKREERLEKKREQQVVKPKPAAKKSIKKPSVTSEQPEQSQIARDVRKKKKKKNDRCTLSEVDAPEMSASELAPPKSVRNSHAKKQKLKRRRNQVVQSEDSDNSGLKPLKKKKKKTTTPARKSETQGEPALVAQPSPAPDLDFTADLSEPQHISDGQPETDYNTIL